MAFTARPDLLPPGETVEQHLKWQKEESDTVQRDRTSKDPNAGGLFRGSFRARFETGLHAIRDVEDGVDRCPLCAWELEDSRCAQCGLLFDADGVATFGSGFSGFSDMDETSEHDPSSEDLDAELELEDEALGFEYAGYGAASMDDWQDQYDEDQSFSVRRWLGGNAIPQPGPAHANAPRRRAAHSAAGGRRQSYTSSLVSDIYTEDTEMGVLEEEDEEDEIDDDSSMRDFIENTETEENSVSGSSSAHATDFQAGSRSRDRSQRTTTSGYSSNQTASADFDEPDDDDGPIPNGRHRHRARPQTNRGAGRRGRLASSVSTEVSSEVLDLEEDDDMQALLEEGYAPLGPDGGEDDFEGSEDGSDGGSTTVGWEPTAISHDRYRARGSLTPTADRPNTHNIRPPSRTGASRYVDGSRGLRRRSSVLSTASHARYEDGEADDDDSDVDHSVNAGSSRSATSAVLRHRVSGLQQRESQSANQSRRIRGAPTVAAVADGDTDDASDNSNMSTRRHQRARSRRQEYDPRISYLLAQHQTDIREMTTQQHEALLDHLEQLRASTPIARPRTANRNRGPAPPNSASPFSPLSNGSLPPFSPPMPAPPRLRTPAEDRAPFGSFPNGLSVRSDRSSINTGGTAPSERGSSGSGTVIHRQGPALPVNNNSAMMHGHGNASSTILFPPSPAAPQNFNHSSNDIVDRPASRVSSRPPSASGRRGPSQYASPYHGLAMAPGLNFAARSWQTQTRNPFVPFYVRPRQSNHMLREQSSTNTLRARNSQRNLNQQPSPGDAEAAMHPAVRSQASRVSLRPRASRQRLQNQASVRNLRSTEGQGPSSQNSVMGPTSPAGGRLGSTVTLGLSEEERHRRAHELIRRRAQELNNNPFTVSHVQHAPSNRSNIPAAVNVQGGAWTFAGHPEGDFQASAGYMVPSSTPQAHLTTMTSSVSPHLARRRSSRNIGVPAGVTMPSPTSNPSNRPRAGQIAGATL